MEYLISMTDFFSKQMNIFNSIICEDRFELENHRTLKTKIENYANFLKQPLSIEQFVPCKLVDGVWVVLEEPYFMDGSYDNDGNGEVDKRRYKKELQEYQEAKDRVLFQGFEVMNLNERISFLTRIDMADYSVITYSFVQNNFLGLKINVESVCGYNLKLTQTAKNQIKQ